MKLSLWVVVIDDDDDEISWRLFPTAAEAHAYVLGYARDHIANGWWGAETPVVNDIDEAIEYLTEQTHTSLWIEEYELELPDREEVDASSAPPTYPPCPTCGAPVYGWEFNCDCDVCGTPFPTEEVA